MILVKTKHDIKIYFNCWTQTYFIYKGDVLISNDKTQLSQVISYAN